MNFELFFMKNISYVEGLLFKSLRLGTAAAALLLLAACAVGPDYVVPQQDTGAVSNLPRDGCRPGRAHR
ncbi:hypothetical protein TKWG_05940 [Advenella kashmirensis WT001]|uniref:Uncharacterized protein n=1 Tax=Advenella kashmirensis (strain DSM 17095 / LMG 22695 / WT001) TaxID=1036672 RepID=I3U9G5_ADVKW|nr:hypothetical protein TKWG_05940 [Advenella kashmirensis WT001]